MAPTSGVNHESDSMTARRGKWLRFVPIAVLAAGAALAYFLAGDYLNLAAIKEHRAALIEWRDSNLVTACLAYVAVYIVSVAFSVPGAIWLTMAGGFLFGTMLAAVLTVFSATIGATLIFLAARSSFGAFLHERAGPWLKRIEGEVAEGEISFLLVMRLIPVIPFFIANLAPAFVNVRLGNFIWTTFIGIAPATAVISSVGAGLGEVLDRGGEPDLGVIFQPHILLPLLGLATLAALPVILRKLRGR
ncbi:MAG TPA: VTT domain-containing protein [Thermohalobaculum sp.]|nr:VTT domain-containing protein [Thermohalobaculum sp.]